MKTQTPSTKQNTKHARTPRNTPSALRQAFISLHDTSGWSWGKIAKNAAGGVPTSTVIDFARGGKCPPKHKRAMGLGGYRDWYALEDAEIETAKQNIQEMR